MTEKQIEIFLVVANNLNISKAADELYTSQPYVSRTIKSLEEDLGVELFVRKNRFMGLTDAGRELLNGLNQLIEKKTKIINDVKSFSNSKEQHFRMGYMHIMFAGTMPAIIHKYKAENLNLNLTMEATDSKSIIDGLYNKHFDLGMVLTMGRAVPGDLEVVHLNSSRIYMVLLESHPLAKKSILTLDSLYDENMIFLPKEMSPFTFPGTKNPFAPESKRFKNHIGAENMFNAISLVKVGAGITPLAKDYSFHCHEDLVFVPVEGVGLMDFSLLWRKNDTNLHIPYLVDHIKSKNKTLLVY